MHSKTKGSIGELAVAKNLRQAGYFIFMELGDLSKVDIMAESQKTGKVYRVQVKYATLHSKGVVTIKADRRGPNYSYKYTSSDFDIIACYCPEIDKVAYLNSSIFDEVSTITLRVEDALHYGGISNVRYFSSFENVTQALSGRTCGTLVPTINGEPGAVTYDVTHRVRKHSTRKTKIKWPSAEKLQTMWAELNHNMSAMGRLLGVSDTAIKAHCKNYGIRLVAGKIE